MAGRRSRFGWAVATVAPWALAAGLLVSFTASAGQPPHGGLSIASQRPAGLDPAATALGRFLVPPSRANAPQRVQVAALVTVPFGPQGARSPDAETGPDPVLTETPPRYERKRDIAAFPELDRSRKTDPLPMLRPTLSRIGVETVRAAGTPLDRLMFSPIEPEVAGAFTGGYEDEIWTGGAFVRDPADETRTGAAGAAASPAAGGGGSTQPARIVSVDGATPASPRALVLSSTTPAPADATPIEVAALPVSFGALPALRTTPGETRIGRMLPVPRDPAAAPRYVDLIEPDAMSREQRCLAEAVYFEARSEPAEGQAAVAQVVLNRVRSGLYPRTVCGVVYQNRHRHLACQFTFACEGKALRITENASWQQAVQVSKAVLEGKTYLPDVGGATHYHADYVRPYWAKRLKKMDVIGRHIFYKLRPGQT